MSTTPSPGPRRRGPAVAASVLDSTLTLLAEHGYDFTIDDVAALAGVHKTTVYRRWETKPVLVAAAMRRTAEQQIRNTANASADTEQRNADPLEELRALAVQVARALRQPAGANALSAALSMAGEDPHLRDTADAFLAARYEHAIRLLAAARDLDRVDADADLRLVWQAIVNPLHINAALGGPLTDETAESLVRIVLRGVASGGGRS